MTSTLPENSKGVPPHDYSAHVTAVLARDAAWRTRRRRNRWVLRGMLVAGLLLCGWLAWRVVT